MSQTILEISDGAEFELLIPPSVEIELQGVGAQGPAGIGLPGPKGDKGDPGADSTVPGPKGDKGDPGADGAEGESAYQIAVDNGFSGTEAEWLESLVGLQGDPGADSTVPGPKGDPGTDGTDGADGESAYQVAVDEGFSGTESEWLASLIGPKGDTGDQGLQGDPGTDGSDGAPGVGIESITRTSGDGSPGTTDTYTITYSDSTTSTFDVYNGADGSGGTGNGLPSTIVNATADYTASVGDFVLGDTTGGAFTVTLPTGSAVGSLVTVKREAGTDILTVDALDIDGDSTASIVGDMAGAVFEHIGSESWRIVAVMAAVNDAVDGLTDPTTTKGDLLVRGSSSVGRFAAGADGTVLMYDSTQTAGVKSKALDDSDVAPVAPNDQTGTTYTFVLADGRRLVTGNNASAQTFTIPPNSSVAFPLGTALQVYQKGAGQITVAAGSGVTLRTPHGAKASAQYAIVTMIQVVADIWAITGDTTT